MKRALLCMFLLLILNSAYAQVPVSLSPVGVQQFLDGAGKPYANGTITTWAAGTNNLQATYRDSTGNGQNTNPIVLDSSGRAEIWLAQQAYKIQLKDAAGHSIWVVDNVKGPELSLLAGSNLWTGTNIFNNTSTFNGDVTATNFTATNITGTVGITGALTGSAMLSSLNNITMVDAATYPTLQAAIASCLNLNGCVVDARNPLIGTQTFTANPFANSLMPMAIFTGPYTVQWDHSLFALTFPSHFNWVMDGTTILNSTGSSGQGIDQLPGILPYITFMGTNVYQTVGTTGAGSAVMTVNNPANIFPGVMVAVIGAGPSLASQTTTLSGALAGPATSITVAATTGWDSGHPAWLKVDNELILCTGTSGGTSFTGCTRGLYGTTATSHLDTTAIFSVGAFISEIVSFNGSSITLADNATFGVTNAPVYFGVTDVSIQGSGTINGNQDPLATTLDMIGMAITYSTNVFVGPGIKIKNFDHGGVLISGGKYNSILAGSYEGNGKPLSSLGGDIWLFENASNNTVRTSSHTRGDIAVIIDDRSDNVSINSGGSSNNLVDLGPIDGPYKGCVDIEGFSSRNTVNVGTCKSATNGIYINSTTQWLGAAPVPTANTVNYGSIDGGAGTSVFTGGYTGGSNVVHGGNTIGSTAMANGDVLVVMNNSALRSTHLGTFQACSDISCSVPLVAGSKVITFSVPYASAPVCLAQDQTTIANTVTCVTTTTTATLTGTGTDTVKYLIVGNPF